MNVEDLTHEQMIGVIKRDRFIKEQLSARIAALTAENMELVAIIQEQSEMLQAREPVPAMNGDTED